MPIPLSYTDPTLADTALQLAQRWQLPVDVDAHSGLVLWLDAQGLALKTLDDTKMGVVRVDFASDQMQWRRKHGGGKKEALARAAGLKGQHQLRVLDATAGLGRDSFLLASLGCRVTMLERTPEVAALLDDGLKRACMAPELSHWLAQHLQLVTTNALEYFKEPRDSFDVVYLDPMFPHRKKSALVKKEMRLFQQLLGPDEDADQLLPPALKLASQRVVVKRPANAPYLNGDKPDVEMKGKANRFDIYLIANRDTG